MKKLITLSLIAIFLTGCAATSSKPTKTSLEIQAIQARNFEADKPTSFKAVLSVLQDLGYVVQAANLDTGVITAQSPTQQDTSGSATFAAIFNKVRTEGRVYVTASVEDMNAKLSRVRLNFVDKKFRSAVGGQQATDEKAIQDPKVYEAAFEKISEAIFIRQAQK
jgi:PBP1b-binding outer membrane lipoprotein LpoB